MAVHVTSGVFQLPSTHVDEPQACPAFVKLHVAPVVTAPPASQSGPSTSVFTGTVRSSYAHVAVATVSSTHIGVAELHDPPSHVTDAHVAPCFVNSHLLPLATVSPELHPAAATTTPPSGTVTSS